MSVPSCTTSAFLKLDEASETWVARRADRTLIGVYQAWSDAIRAIAREYSTYVINGSRKEIPSRFFSDAFGATPMANALSQKEIKRAEKERASRVKLQRAEERVSLADQRVAKRASASKRASARIHNRNVERASQRAL